MQRFIRRRNRPQQGRGPARWTALEIAMLGVAILLIVFPLYAEANRWLNPLIAPAAPRAQADATATDPPGPQRVPTDTPVGATSVAPTATTVPPTATTGSNPTATTVPPTATTGPSPTATAVPPTATTGPSPTATAVPPTATTGPSPTVTAVPPTVTIGPSATATATLIPGTPTATLTPLPNQPPLQLVKGASTSSIQIGEQFNYTLSVFSNSLTNSSVTVRDDVPSQLDVLGASATTGSCTIGGSSVSCTVTARNNQPATITIAVKVSSRASPGSRLLNQAAAQDDRQQTAASDQVSVNVGSQPAPTNTPSGPTNTPTGPTNTPTGPTNTPGGPTDTPIGPTNTPANPTNTPKSGGGNSGGGGSSGGGNGSGGQQLSTPQLPPLPEPGNVITAPTPRPGRVPAPAAGSSGGGQPSGPRATAVPTAVPATPADSGTFFRMASDWGSAFTGQEINYVIAFRNTRTSGALTNLVITSELPDNLSILDRKSDRGDPQLQGNQLTLRIDSLAAGQGVEIAVRAKIKDDVQVDSRLVSQAQASYDGLAAPLSSNVVTVLIVGSDFGPVIQGAATAAPAASTAPAATTAPTATVAPTATTAPKATSAPAGGAAGPSTNLGTAPLPETSSGVPIFGFALLGFTLLLRTVRLHRGQTRI